MDILYNLFLLYLFLLPQLPENQGVNPIYVNLKEATTATQIKFVATSSNNGAKFAGGAEFNFEGLSKN